QSLDLGGTQVTDAGLAEVARLTDLQSLNISNTKVTDKGLKHLAGLKKLQELYLYTDQVTEEGLAQLAGLKLKTLTHSFVLTDLGLKHYLAAIEPPTRLDFSETKGTDVGLKALAGRKGPQAPNLAQRP